MKKCNPPMLLIVLVLSSIFFCQTAWAHDLWVTADPYVLAKTGLPSLAVFSAHKFPAGAEDYLAAEMKVDFEKGIK